MGSYTPEQVARQAEMLANRVRKRFVHLKKRFDRERIEAFRLYDWDIPEVRAVVDWYAGHLVVAEYERTQTGPGWLEQMAAAVASALKVPDTHVHLKRRTTGTARGPQYGRGRAPGPPLIVHERDLAFLVDLDGPLDTGLFCDHRETRRLVRERAHGAVFLNLFCYTGAFTCAAAAGGASETVSVDRSATHLRRVRENLALNGLDGPRHHLVRADVERFLDPGHSRDRRYTLAVVDPPSFSRSRDLRRAFDVTRDHPALLARVLDRMAPGGTVIFSTNHRRFEPRFDGLRVASFEEITARTIPEDYAARPVHRAFLLIAS